MGSVWSIFGEEMKVGYTDPFEQTGSDAERGEGDVLDVQWRPEHVEP